MTDVTVDYTGFITTFSEFGDIEEYPQLTVTSYIDIATGYITKRNSGALKDNARVYAIYLMTAHLLTLRKQIQNNVGEKGTTQIGFETSASIGDVSVSMQMPSVRNQLDYWFSLTGYGLELRALLSLKAPTPIAIGGKFSRFWM